MKALLIHWLRAISKMRLVPLSWKLALASHDRRLSYLLPCGEDVLFERYLGDVRVKIDSTYPIERAMLSGEYDRTTSFVLRQALDADSVAIDVGANVGALSLLMAKLCTDGRVIAIEPGPPTCLRLRENLRLNPALEHRVTVQQVGVSDQPGSMFWNQDSANRGNGGLLQKSGVEVPVVTLDSVIERLSLSRLDLIKIDVEGMESEVIKGAMVSIRNFRPIVYYETLESFRTFRGFDCYGQIFDQLQREGYHHFYLDDQGAFNELSDMQTLRAQNAVAIPREREARFV